MSDRIHVDDPAFMRRARRRMTVALVMVLILTSFFTAGGISLVAAGELPGLPLAIGGAVLQIAAIVLVVATLRVGRSLDGQTVTRSSLRTARRTAGAVRLTAVVTLLALLLYGAVRFALGDHWSIVTAGIIGIALFFLARGGKALRRAHDQSLDRSS